MPKRKNYISWDELFMGIAELASRRSKDPSTQHGSCIVLNNKVVAIGYNGLPRGLDDNGESVGAMPMKMSKNTKNGTYDYWSKPDKYEFSSHSEENAIINAERSLKGATIYLYSEKGYYPCSTCARMIVQSGITKVIMKTAIKEDTDKYNWDYTKHMFKKAGVSVRILYNT